MKIIYVAKFSIDYAKVLPSLKDLNGFLDMTEMRVVSRANAFEARLEVDSRPSEELLNKYKEVLVEQFEQSFGQYGVKLESFEEESQYEH